MFANDIFNVIDELVPRKYALKNDNIGYFSKNYENLDIKNINVLMDLLPEDDLKFEEGELVISHHPPLFMPKTPTYVVHSRICSSTKTLDQFLAFVCYKFGPENVRLVNDGDFDKMLRKIAIVSGFGLSNKEFIKLAKDRSVDAFVSGDLNHSNAILAKKLGVTLIDVSHHIIELPGLFALTQMLKNNHEIDVPVEMIDTGVPWKYISADF